MGTISILLVLETRLEANWPLARVELMRYPYCIAPSWPEY
jgi:hypothetical protein